MPQSTDAILCYGFQVGKEDEPPEWLIDDEDEDDGSTMDFETFVARLREITEPEGAWSDERDEEWCAYWQDKRDAVKQEGVEIVDHCHSEHTMRILAVTDSVTFALRGLPVELGQGLEGPGGRRIWYETLRRFCERAGIPFEEPQWILCSYWSV